MEPASAFHGFYDLRENAHGVCPMAPDRFARLYCSRQVQR